MKACIAPLALMGLFIAIASSLDAQAPKDKDSDPKKAEPKKKIVRVDESIVLASPFLRAKIRDLRVDDDAKEVILSVINVEKYQEYVQWDQKFQQDIPRIINLDDKQKKEYYQKETANRLDQVFDGPSKSVFYAPELRVRTSWPPKMFDAAGNERKATPTELAKLKSGTRLPGYNADFGVLRVGQIVDVYVPKSSVQPKQPMPKTKKDFIEIDPALGNAPAAKVPAYMIYVIQDAP